MDDPAVWVHPTDPSRSLVLGNNKRAALETYDLAGNRVQRISDSVTFWGNVDVRRGCPSPAWSVTSSRSPTVGSSSTV